MLKLKVKKINPQAQLPLVAHPNEDLGYDLFYNAVAAKPIQIEPGQQVMLQTGLAMEHTSIWLVTYDNGVSEPREFPIGLIGKQPSGMANKKLLDVKAGVIDAGYKNEIAVLLYNYGKTRQLVYPGDKVGQLVPILCLTGSVEEVSELSESKRGLAGWGSGHKS